MNLILIGMPGSGKTTQGDALSSKLNIPYLSSGKILRKLSEAQTPRGEHMRTIMNSGNLLPDDETIEIIEEHLAQPEYKHGYILDGFPRTMYQAEKCRLPIDKVIYIELTDEEAIRRIAHRAEKRNDQSPEATRLRLRIFHDETDKLIDQYEKMGLLLRIDGSPSIEQVTADILAKLSAK